NAPATPCTARNAIRNPIDGASAHSKEAAPNAPTPSANTRRSPKMSPSDPPSRTNEPSVSRYALATHCWPARPPPRLRWIEGSATLTTLVARMAMLDPRTVATSVNCLLDADELSVGEDDETVAGTRSSACELPRIEDLLICAAGETRWTLQSPLLSGQRRKG